MSPVDQSRHHVGQAATVALVSIVILALALLATAMLIHAKGDSSGVRLGDQTFSAGSAEKKAELIAESGPLLYPDVSGRNERPIFLQHLGEDPEDGWYAFLAYPIDRSADCAWEWEAEAERFRASCDDDLTLPADGDGATQYRVTVRDGEVEVDLNADRASTGDATTTTVDPPSTTAAASPTTTGG